MKNIYFDHTYTADQNHRLLKKMETLGFRLSDHQMEHPGGHVCRFVLFPSAKNAMSRDYLEFIHVKPNGKPVKTPGLSFASAKDVERFHKKMLSTGQLNTHFMHRNYDWKKDSKSKLPGWNFVTFKNLGFGTFYPWITEYEPNPAIKKKRKIVKAHPNGVFEISGLEFDVNTDGEKFFKALVGKTQKPSKTLPCGTEFHFNKAKKNKIRNIIMRTKNLKRFMKKYKTDGEVTFNNKPAALIKNPNKNMWNILIIE